MASLFTATVYPGQALGFLGLSLGEHQLLHANKGDLSAGSITT